MRDSGAQYELHIGLRFEFQHGIRGCECHQFTLLQFVRCENRALTDSGPENRVPGRRLIASSVLRLSNGRRGSSSATEPGLNLSRCHSCQSERVPGRRWEQLQATRSHPFNTASEQQACRSVRVFISHASLCDVGNGRDAGMWVESPKPFGVKVCALEPSGMRTNWGVRANQDAQTPPGV